MPVLNAAQVVRGLEPSEDGRLLAEAVLAHPSWFGLTIDVTYVPASILISVFFNTFMQTICERDPSRLDMARILDWETRHTFQRQGILEWALKFKPYTPPAQTPAMKQRQEWIGVDLDGTLAHQSDPHDESTIGAPIGPMVERVKRWIAEGKTVWIFTARLSGNPGPHMKPMIEEWCLKHLGVVLPITNVKEHGLIKLWDDRAVGVVRNTGQEAPKLDCCPRCSAIHLTEQKGEQSYSLTNPVTRMSEDISYSFSVYTCIACGLSWADMEKELAELATRCALYERWLREAAEG